jgi:2-methylcitrate dehydratase
MALIDGDVTVKQFDTGRWKSPDVLALAAKVRVDAVPNAPRGGGATVRLTAGGEKIEKRIDIPDGDPRRPMSAEALANKFGQFAAPALGKSRADAVLDMCRNVEKIGDVRELTKLLAAG